MDKRIEKTRGETVAWVASRLKIDELKAYKILALCNYYKNEWYRTFKANYNSNWFCLQTANDYFDFSKDGIKKAIAKLKKLKIKPYTIIDLGAGIGLSTKDIQKGFPNAEVFYNNVDGQQCDLAKRYLINTRVEFAIEDSLKLKDYKADTLFAFEFFEHFSEPLLAFKTITDATEADVVVMQNSFGAFGYGHFPYFYHNKIKIPCKDFKRFFRIELSQDWDIFDVKDSRVIIAIRR